MKSQFSNPDFGMVRLMDGGGRRVVIARRFVMGETTLRFSHGGGEGAEVVTAVAAGS